MQLRLTKLYEEFVRQQSKVQIRIVVLSVKRLTDLVTDVLYIK
jgi:hypothetical protein